MATNLSISQQQQSNFNYISSHPPSSSPSPLITINKPYYSNNNNNNHSSSWNNSSNNHRGQHVGPRNIFKPIVWLFFGLFVFNIIILHSAIGPQVKSWYSKVWQTLYYNYNTPTSSSTKIKPTITTSMLSRDQMSPHILRDHVLRTDSGLLRGFIQNVNGIEIGTYLSIPYGQPPVDKLRFRPTQPIKRWVGIRNATRPPPPCVQSEYTQRLFPVHILNESITENCLFLNIWSPSSIFQIDVNINNTKNTNKSVMVLIHGGLFTIGSTSIDEYDGRMLAARGDVVVVTVQYRLGIFGFLDLGTPEVPGNMGLYDQYTALQWISTNIHHFGGDPNSVTLFGTSAGAISIGFHMFNRQASSLFHRAILQSGSPMLIRQVYTRGQRLAEKFFSIVGCDVDDDDQNRNVNVTTTSPFSPNDDVNDDNEEVDETSEEDEDEVDDDETVGNIKKTVNKKAIKMVECLDRLSFSTIYQAQDRMVKNNPVPFMPTIPSDYIESVINDYSEETIVKQKDILMGK